MSIWLKSDPVHLPEASCFPQSCPPNSIACLHTELILKQTQDNPEIDQEYSTFQICTYTFKDAIFARYTDGGNIMCSLLSQCLHSCTVPDLIQVALDCSLGLCLTDTHKFLIGSLLRPLNLYCLNKPRVCPDGFSHLFLLIFSITLYHPLWSSWSCKQVCWPASQSCVQHGFCFLHSCQINKSFLQILQQGCFYWCNVFVCFLINHEYSVLLPACTATSLLKVVFKSLQITIPNYHGQHLCSNKRNVAS